MHPPLPDDIAPAPVSGTEFASIVAARRATILIVSALVVLLHLLDELDGTTTRSMPLTIAAGLLVIGGAVIRQAWAPWLAVVAILVTALTALTTPQLSALRVNESTTIFVAAYFGVVLCSRRWGPPWIAAMLAAWLAVVGSVPLDATMLGVTVNIRWFTAVQLVVSATWLWWFWEPAVTGARQRDAAVRASEDARITAIAARERVRVWREAAIRTHETLLNDIRYVLSTSRVDAVALGHQLDAHEDAATPPESEVATARSLVDAVSRAENLGPGIHYTGPLVAIDPTAVTAVHSALTEFVRNARRHSGATSFTVVARDDVSRPVLELRHDGTPHEPDSGPGSIGTRIVLAEGLRAFSIDVDVHARGVDLVLPSRAPRGVTSAREVPDVGRSVVSTTTAANAVGGALFAVALALTGGAGSLISGAALLAVVLLAARSAHRHLRASPALLIGTALLAAVVPLLGLSAVGSCSTSELVVITSVLAGLGVSAVLAWAPGVVWWALAAPWAFGVVALGVNLPGQCRQPADASLVTAAVPALFAVVIYLSLGGATRRAQDAERLRLREARETAAADAAVDLGAHLDAAVLEARSLLRTLADGAALTDDSRRRLRCLDGQIRAALQVDPSRSGGMSRSAQALVQRVTEAGIPVRVLYLSGSPDPRPLDERAMTVLERALLAATDGSAVLQLVDSPEQDTLVVTVSAASAQAAGLDIDSSLAFEDGMIDIDRGDSDDHVVIIVERTARPDRRAT